MISFPLNFIPRNANEHQIIMITLGSKRECEDFLEVTRFSSKGD